MATPTSQPHLAARPKHSKLVKCIALILLTLIVLVGLIVLIIWLAVRPKQLVYTVEAGSIHGFNLANNHLDANFDFILRSVNPNRRVSLYYDKMEVKVFYNDQTIAFSMVESFFQPHRNVTQLEVKPVAKSVTLSDSVSRDLRLEKSSGGIQLVIKMKARIRFKVGVWKSRHRRLRIVCSSVLVHFASSNNFKKVACHYDV